MTTNQTLISPDPYADNIKYTPIPVSTRTISWIDVATAAWGDEWAQPDHDIYVFSNGASYDSTDQGLTGVYGVVGEDGPDFLLYNDQYPDMRNQMFGSEGFNGVDQYGNNWEVEVLEGNNVPDNSPPGPTNPPGL